MKIIQTKDRGAEILRLIGPLTAGDGIRVLRALENELPGLNVVLDLSRVDYIDAAGVGELLRLHREIQSRDGALVLTGVASKVRDILTVTRLNGQFKLAETHGEALEQLGLTDERRPARRTPRHGVVPALAV